MSKLHKQVVAFHKKFGQPIGDRPKVPDEKMVRFRLKLHVEELIELLEAGLESEVSLKAMHQELNRLIDILPVHVNLPEFIDALGDLDYISEGTRVVFGVDGDPIADEIQRANMAKEPLYESRGQAEPPGVMREIVLGALGAATIKPVKPPGWTPPDIERVLIEQGWKPGCRYCGNADCTEGCRT